MVATESAAPGGRGRPPLSGESCGSQRPSVLTWSAVIRPARTTRSVRRSPPLDHLAPLTHRSSDVGDGHGVARRARASARGFPREARPARRDDRDVHPRRGASSSRAAARHRPVPRDALLRRRRVSREGARVVDGTRASSVPRPRREAPPRAARSPPPRLGDVAGTLGLSLSGFGQPGCYSCWSFGALLGASGVYCYKVSVVVRRRVETRITARENGAPDARTRPRSAPRAKMP